jgi:hypothetical protein
LEDHLLSGWLCVAALRPWQRRARHDRSSLVAPHRRRFLSQPARPVFPRHAP